MASGLGAPNDASLPNALSSPPTVNVTYPGSQAVNVGTPVSLQMQAPDSTNGQTLTWSVDALPAGLFINASTGLISGTPTAGGTSTPLSPLRTRQDQAAP